MPAYTAPPPAGYQGSYAQNLHSFGGSVPFLVGVILFTAGTLFAAMSNFSVFTIFSLLLPALPIIGLWLIFAASKKPITPEKTFPALTLVKVYTIIGMVLFCIGLAGVAILGAVVLVGAGWLGGGAVAAAVIGVLIAIGIMVAYLIFYYIALLKILNGIRDGLTTNVFTPLRGVIPFSVLAWISIGIVALNAIVTLAAAGFLQGFYNDLLWEVPREFRGVVEGLLPSPGGLQLASFFSLVGAAGQGVLLVMLSRFNQSLFNRY
jgi:hypothetical protein